MTVPANRNGNYEIYMMSTDKPEVLSNRSVNLTNSPDKDEVFAACFPNYRCEVSLSRLAFLVLAGHGDQIPELLIHPLIKDVIASLHGLSDGVI